jgi:hypothetical protein
MCTHYCLHCYCRWGHGSLVWLEYATWLSNHSEGPDECRALLLRAITTVKAEDASTVVCNAYSTLRMYTWSTYVL